MLDTLSVFCDLLQNQSKDGLREHLMNLLSDKASYEAAAKVCLVDSCDRSVATVLSPCLNDKLPIKYNHRKR